jgi:hypothetical protein
MLSGETCLTCFPEPTRDLACAPMAAVKRSTAVVIAAPLDGSQTRRARLNTEVGKPVDIVEPPSMAQRDDALAVGVTAHLAVSTAPAAVTRMGGDPRTAGLRSAAGSAADEDAGRLQSRWGREAPGSQSRLYRPMRPGCFGAGGIAR